MTTTNDRRPPLPVRAVLFVVFRSLKTLRHATQRFKTGWRTFTYRSRSSQLGSAAWKTAAFLKAPRETRYRRVMAKGYTERVTCAEMPAQRGFCLLEPDHFEQIGEVISTCRELFERKVAAGVRGVEQDSQLKLRAAKHEYLRSLLSNEDLRREPLLVDFALSDAVMGIATNYLGTVPCLNRVDLLYSAPRSDEQKVSSQLFHVDPEGLSQVKFFINVFGVGEAEGPFTFIPADQTARIVRDVSALRRKQGKQHAGRYLDDEIAAVGASDTIVRIKGPEGSGVAVDTSRCLHMGSRVQPGAFRLCLYLQYCTTRERGNAFDIDRYRRDPVRSLAVRHSQASTAHDVSAPHQMGGMQ